MIYLINCFSSICKLQFGKPFCPHFACFNTLDHFSLPIHIYILTNNKNHTDLCEWQSLVPHLRFCQTFLFVDYLWKKVKSSSCEYMSKINTILLMASTKAVCLWTTSSKQRKHFFITFTGSQDSLHLIFNSKKE